MENVVISPNVFKTMQVNGQRITVNHILVHNDGEGYEVFVGHLPRNLYENELLPVLLAVGNLRELRIMMNFSGHTRGFAFARFANKESAVNAVKFLHNFEIRPRCRIAVIASRDRKKLFIGHLPTCMKAAILSEIIRKATANVANIEMKYFTRRGICNQYCIVEYKTHMDACKARRELAVHGKQLFHYRVVIDWAYVDKNDVGDKKDCKNNQKDEPAKYWINRWLNELQELNHGDKKPQPTEMKKADQNKKDLLRSKRIHTPPDSFRSEGSVCEPIRQEIKCGEKRMWAETPISQPQGLNVSQNIRFDFFTTPMMEWQICGPYCLKPVKTIPLR